MRRIVLILSSLSLLLLQISWSSPQLPSETGRIEGVVLRAGTGTPVPGAEVTLAPAPPFPPVPGQPPPPAAPRPVITDEQGRFAFQNLTPYTYRILAAGAGYVRQEYGVRGIGLAGLAALLSGSGVRLASGETAQGLVIHLTPAGAVSGRVTANGQPVLGLEVVLAQPVYDPAGRRISRIGGAIQTDDRGIFRITGVTPGSYYVSVGPPTLVTRSSVPERGGAFGGNAAAARQFSTAYYPSSTTDLDKAEMIRVEAGAEVGDLDFTMRAASAYRIRGRIIDMRTGQPPNERVSISWYLRDALYGPSGTGSDNTPASAYKADGAFELTDLLPGKYWIVVTLRIATPAPRGAGLAGIARDPISQAFVPLEITAGDVENVVVRLTPRVTVSAQVDLDGGPISMLPGFEQIRLSLQGPVAGSVSLVAPPQPMPVQADGTLTLQSVQPGDYRINAGPLPPDVYMKSATLGSMDVLNGGLQVPESNSDVLKVTLSRKSGRIQGIAADDAEKAVPFVQVVLVPERLERTDLYRTAIADAKGGFRISGIVPGDDRMFAWDSIDPEAYFDRKFTAGFEEKGTRLSVAESSDNRVNLKVLAR